AQERSTGARLALARDLQGQAYPTTGEASGQGVQQVSLALAPSCPRRERRGQLGARGGGRE
ncbi:MAG: hypothetical protein L0387_35110, partial [Acidobacteria bacterium]|nr:hypothetical protein [Acidobacteriota bacterium]